MIEVLMIALKNKIVRQVLIIFALCLLIGGVFAYLTYQKNKAEKEATAARTEANRLNQQAEGLKILVNTANIAKEVEDGRKIANQQEINSNIANHNFSNSLKRDSSEFSSNYAEAKRKFCQDFREDSRCR